jgi:hypothetical protein
MILNDALLDPIASQLYMERYVNRGSPSGFSSINTTSTETSHLGNKNTFWLHAVRPPPRYDILEFGVCNFEDPGLILLHPDLLESCFLLDGGELIENYLEVSPTSSDRTVQAVAKPNLYYKLSYPPLIGRMSRQLGVAQGESAVWVTSAIDRSRDKIDPRFKFLREGYARVAVTDAPVRREWGFTVRDKYPSPSVPATDLMIPGFSLFSRDKNSPDDEFLLIQLYERQNKPLAEFLFQDLIAPLLDSYFSLLIHCGLQLEAHAQNILFGISTDGVVTSIVARDAESVDRDLSLMEDLKIVGDRPSGDYKIIQRSDYNYHIMHSFMFDFKMGQYLIQPILDCAYERGSTSYQELSEHIRGHVRTWTMRLPEDFFPADGCWYSYDDVIHDRGRQRDYLATSAPKFR